MTPRHEKIAPRYWYFITWTDSAGQPTNSMDEYLTIPEAYRDAIDGLDPDDKAKPRIRVAWKGNPR